MNENINEGKEGNLNQISVSDINVEDQEQQVLIKTQEELTKLLIAVKNGESIDEKYKSCMKKINIPEPRVDLFRCFKDGFIAKGVIKNVDDIFQHLVFNLGPDCLLPHDNYADKVLICQILCLICQPKFNINRIKNCEWRLAAAVFDIDAIRTNQTKYIFNLKEQMKLGIINPQNYNDEDHIQDFLLPNSIDDINDLVKFMGYDSENHESRVLPKISYWELMCIPPKENVPDLIDQDTGKIIRYYGPARGCLKTHSNRSVDNDVCAKIEELKRTYNNKNDLEKLRADLRSKYEKIRNESGAIKDFDQFKKIVDFPSDQDKLPSSHTMFFANGSVRDGVEFLKLFDDKSKSYILTDKDKFRIFKPGAFSFETRGDIEKFLKEECKFRVYDANLIHCTIAIIVDLAIIIFDIIKIVLLLLIGIPVKIMSCAFGRKIDHYLKLRFFKYTRRVYEMNRNETFELAIKNIEDNCAAGKLQNNSRGGAEIENNQKKSPNLEQPDIGANRDPYQH